MKYYYQAYCRFTGGEKEMIGKPHKHASSSYEELRLFMSKTRSRDDVEAIGIERIKQGEDI